MDSGGTLLLTERETRCISIREYHLGDTMTDCIRPTIPHDLTGYFQSVFWPRKLGRSSRTKELYRLTIVVFERWLTRKATIDDLNDDTVCGFLQHRIEKVSSFSAAKDRSNLLSIATFAAKKRHLPEFLDLPIIPVSFPTPHAMRPEQFNALLAATAKMVRPEWWLALLLTFLVTGERTEATLSLRWEWLDSDGWLRVPACARKGRKKGAVYHLPPAVVRAVEKLRRSDSEAIFERSYCIETFYDRYERLLKHAGLPTGRRWKPQCLRQTFGSYVRLLTGDTNPLKHDSAATFNRHYNDPTLTSGPQPSSLVADAFGIA